MNSRCPIQPHRKGNIAYYYSATCESSCITEKVDGKWLKWVKNAGLAMSAGPFMAHITDVKPQHGKCREVPEGDLKNTLCPATELLT
jgi:hypothetical protein